MFHYTSKTPHDEKASKAPAGSSPQKTSEDEAMILSRVAGEPILKQDPLEPDSPGVLKEGGSVADLLSASDTALNHLHSPVFDE